MFPWEKPNIIVEIKNNIFLRVTNLKIFHIISRFKHFFSIFNWAKLKYWDSFSLFINIISPISCSPRAHWDDNVMGPNKNIYLGGSQGVKGLNSKHSVSSNFNIEDHSKKN